MKAVLLPNDEATQAKEVIPMFSLVYESNLPTLINLAMKERLQAAGIGFLIGAVFGFGEATGINDILFMFSRHHHWTHHSGNVTAEQYHAHLWQYPLWWGIGLGVVFFFMASREE